MSAYSSIFGETLLSKSGPVPVSSLDNQYVGVYFSAHWCGNCRQFTPKLRKIYLDLKKQNVPFEVVFCSADKDTKGFEEYFASMPWLAVPFENEETRKNLNSLFEVSGIPRFVMLSPEGVINPNARNDVESNPEGFPWKQPTPREWIASSLVKGAESVSDSILDNTIYGLYFSAHWCTPCKRFTPRLVEVYNQLAAAGKPFEVVFCSMDNDEKEYQEYYASMPWCSIGFQNPILNKVKEQLAVEGIPSLVLFDGEGNIITGDGRSAIESTGAEGYPWIPAAVKDLNQEPDDINEKPCVVVFMEGDCYTEEQKEQTIQSMNAVAEQFRGSVSFFYAKESGDVSNQIRAMIQSEKTPLLSIVDIVDNGGYYIAESGEITGEVIDAFVRGYLNKEIERKQMVA